ncbi:GntR family transcriptional regulator [Nonomuraea sp. NPDC049028]|uniref:GntR family transcriptional regulator n=1 Tax=Nonomuraea sp. NPDC049028 TaxID=3364348 RepID=UPI0037120F7C
MTDAADRTLYVKVANDLRAKIASGALRVGEAIPSTKELERQHGVSATAARNGVALLRNEGLVEGVAGKGVFVIAKPQEVEAERVNLEDIAVQIAELRDEVRALAARVDDQQSGRDLASEVAELRALVEQLYNRLGHPMPSIDAATSVASSHLNTGTQHPH